MMARGKSTALFSFRPKRIEESLKIPPGPPQERPRHAEDRPRGLQDSPKSAQEASHAAPRGLQDRARRPSGGQEAPRGLQGVISDPFCLHFRSHLDAESIPPTALRTTVCVCHLQGPELSQALQGFSRHLSFPHTSDPAAYMQG